MLGWLRKKPTAEQLVNRAFKAAIIMAETRFLEHQRYGASTNTGFPTFQPLDCEQIHIDKTHDQWVTEQIYREMIESGPDGPL